MNEIAARGRRLMDEAFTKIGGLDRMVQWANENTTEFYKLWAKTTIPAQVTGSIDVNHIIRRNFTGRMDELPPASLPVIDGEVSEVSAIPTQLPPMEECEIDRSNNLSGDDDG